MGEVRSLLPKEVKVMALTATATKPVRLAVINTLGMKKTHVVAFSPVKKNLMYAVSTFENVEDSFGPVVRRLKVEHALFPRMIIFTRSISMAGHLFIFHE